MNKNTKILLLPVVTGALAFALMAGAAGPTNVDLGSADNFAVLAGSTITNTGSTVITGDLGLSPGSSVTGFPPGTIVGTQHVGDATAVQAQTDLASAYTDAAGRTPVTTIPTELGGTTIKPGIYDSAAGTFGVTGTLTLDAAGDADAVFVFKTASTLITAGSSTVALTNSAQACHVFFQVGSSATLGTNSTFKGNILALTSVTLTTGANVSGRVLARNGAVTLDTNTVTRATCASVPAPAPVVNTNVAVVNTNTTVANTNTTVANTNTTVANTNTTVNGNVNAVALPNTGMGPDNADAIWYLVIPIGLLASLYVVYAMRRKQKV